MQKGKSVKKLLMIVTLLLLALSTGLVAAQDAPAPGEAFTTEPRRCPVQLNVAEETEGQTYRCGLVYLPENYDEPEGRIIELTYMVLHSTSMTPEPDPVVYLSGGPGGSALTEMSEEGTNLRASFGKIRERRDVITFDQRGDRYSSMLYCSGFVQLFTDDFVAPQELAENETYSAFLEMYNQLSSDVRDTVAEGICGRALRSFGTDIGQYNSANSARDIQHLVELTGYPGQYNLYGVSYGTRLSLTAMRDTPESIRSVVLDSTYPPEIQNYETSSTLYTEPYQQVFGLCAADPTCNAEYPNLEQRFIDLLTRIGEEPLVVDPPIDTAGTLVGTYLIPGDTLTEITPELFINIATISNRSPGGGFWPYVPFIIHYLEAGDVQTFADVVNGVYAPPPQAPILTPELQRLQDAQQAEAAAAAELVAATQAEIDAARAELLSTQWVQIVTTDLDTRNSAGEDIGLETLEFIWLPLEPRSIETLTSFAADDLTADAAAAANTLAEQMTNEDLRETFELVQGAGINAVGYDQTISHGQNFAVECYEEVPFQNADRELEIRAALPYPYLFSSDLLVPGRIGICSIFEEVGIETPAIENERVESEIPTLILQGLIDTSTPASWGASAAEGLSNSFLVYTAQSGHTVLTKIPCAPSLTAHFVDHPDTLPDTSCVPATFPHWILVSVVEQNKARMNDAAEATPEATEASA